MKVPTVKSQVAVVQCEHHVQEWKVLEHTSNVRCQRSLRSKMNQLKVKFWFQNQETQWGKDADLEFSDIF